MTLQNTTYHRRRHSSSNTDATPTPQTTAGLFAAASNRGGCLSHPDICGRVSQRIRHLGAQKPAKKPALTSDAYSALLEQINPKAGYTLPIDFGNLGYSMVEAGVINRDFFIQVYQKAGQPLTDEQMAILDGTFTRQVAMNSTNAYFLLNFFWAIGLASQNPILDSGPIQKSGQNGIEGFASTGGWTLATRPIREIFFSVEMFAS